MKVCVLGGGSWGSAFALHLGSKGLETNLWILEKNVYEQTIRYRENKDFLPGAVFPSSVSFYNNLEDALLDVDILFIAIPSKFCRSVYEQVVPFLSPSTPLVSLTKGIEENSLLRMSQVLEKVFSPHFPPKTAVLSGPSFAREVAEVHPTAVVIAAEDITLAKDLQRLVSNLSFRAYTSEDVVGLEIAGALKNVIAIAAGISEGLQFGANSMAALVTRGLAELTRLGVQLGAKQETFAGLAGVGDLVLTCTGRLSRNRYVGCELGKGRTLSQIVSGMKMIAEGITTTLSGWQLAQKSGVDMPICEQVFNILHRGEDPRTALQNLMSRKLKGE